MYDEVVKSYRVDTSKFKGAELEDKIVELVIEVSTQSHLRKKCIKTSFYNKI